MLRPMRPATIGLLALASLLPGAVPGSPTGECRAFEPPPQGVWQDVHRLVEPVASRYDHGVTRLVEAVIEPRPVPFDGLDIASFHKMMVTRADLLGPASVGKPTRGFLLNGKQLPSSPFWQIQVPDRAWGTPELVACLERSVSAVHEQFPGSAPLPIGDLSRRDGGYLRGHVSHQSGLDADLGFYYHGETAWYLEATEKNLDRDRTWALLRALVTDCDVEYVFVDFLVVVLLRSHAEELGEDPAWLDGLFAKGPRKPGIVRHAWGHRTHMHVRIHDEPARALGERVEQAQRWGKERNLLSVPNPPGSRR